ncbi:MAG: hypothetical protein KKA42_15020, partial [candidate division Zixibacteria bacterium]|nr:hypothetical protein [candidate division Zixibacteria bacterium]
MIAKKRRPVLAAPALRIVIDNGQLVGSLLAPLKSRHNLREPNEITRNALGQIQHILCCGSLT